MDRKENPFDQFDSASPNPFDQFDEAPVAQAANPFDQFDKPEAGFLERAKTAVTDFFAPSPSQPAAPVVGRAEDYVPPTQPAPPPLSEDARRQLDRKYDALSPEERDKIISGRTKDKRQTLEGMYFAYRDQQYKQQDAATKGLETQIGSMARRISDLGDPRKEARERVARRQGASPQTASNMAAQSAIEGLPTEEVIPQAKESKFDFDLASQYKTLNPVVRGAVKGYYGYKQSVLGLNQALGDLVGTPDFADVQRAGAEQAAGRVEAIGERPDYLSRNFEGAISSLTQNIPGILGGIVSGGATIPLAVMGVQSFGQNYTEGVSRGLDRESAAKRASVFAAAEILGERFGLTGLTNGVRKAFGKKSFDEATDAVSRYIISQIPGEQLTTVTQFLADKYPSFALNPQAGFKDYLQQAGDTLTQTIMQGGVMMGGVKGAELLAGRRAAEPTEPRFAPAPLEPIQEAPRRVEPTLAPQEPGAVPGIVSAAETVPEEPEAPLPVAVEPAIAPAENLASVGSLGAGIAESLRNQLWDSYSKGSNVMAGIKDPVLVAARQAGIPENDKAAFNQFLTDYTSGKTKPAETNMPPAAKPAVTPPQEPPTETSAEDLPTVFIPLKDLTLSKDVPQFKMGADEKGVVEPLGGKFERGGVAPIQVWRRLDGSLEVISGRHRLDLARRSGEKTIPSQIYDEAQGFTPQMAAVLDAELNIRDGQGKVKDYVNYFKASGIDPQDAESRGLLARATGKRAFTVASQGSDELVAAIRNDQVPDEAAYFIALNAPNDSRLQGVGLQAVMDGKSANIAVNTMQAVKALGIENNTTTDMFGFDDSALKEAQAMAQVAARKQREIQTRLSAISGAAKNPAIAKAEGIDIRDPNAVNQRIQELRQAKAAWDNWSTNPDLIGEIRQARGVQAPELTLRGETEEEIRAREEAAAAEEQRLRAEEGAARQAEQQAAERARAEETVGLFELGQTPDQQLSGMGDLFASQEPAVAREEPAEEERKPGATDDEVKKVGDVFEKAQEGQVEDDFEMHHLFDPPAKEDIVRLTEKEDFLTPEQAKAKIAEWRKNAEEQDKKALFEGKMNPNSDKVVLSLFDLTGAWSEPWVEAGYQVYRFDIQDKWTMTDETTGEEVNLGDINQFSVQYFQDLFGDFEGNDVYAILAACPCTDFASSGARHFKAKDANGKTMDSINLVKKTLAVIDYWKPSIWAIENPVGRIEKLGGLPPWRLSFEPYMFGDPYTKKTLLWGRFNADLPTAPVEPTEGSKMHRMYGGKSLATKNARSVTPEGFAYAFFQANNAIDNPVMAIANKYDRLDRDVIQQALDAGLTEYEIQQLVDDPYYFDGDDEAAENALRAAIAEKKSQKPAVAKKKPEAGRVVDMTARREAQIEAQEEAEEAAEMEESRVAGIKRLKGYKPEIQKIWAAVTKAEGALKKSELPNSLEHRELQRQVDELKNIVNTYNAIGPNTPLGASELSRLPLALQLVKEENKLENLANLTKQVSQGKPGEREYFNIEPEFGSEPEFGYHAGNGQYARDTVLGRMAGRGTGHFGTGVYMYSSKQKIKASSRANRPIIKIDLSKYTLATPRDAKDAQLLHDGLRMVNDFPTRERDIRQAAINIWMGTLYSNIKGETVEDIYQVIQDVVKEAKAEYEQVAHTNAYVDSASTRVMKRLGYDGIDVRHIPEFDTGEYGTVVYEQEIPDQTQASQQVLADSVVVDGKRRPTTNSDGLPIYPTEGGIRNFWKEFGDSVLVDAQGHPIRMYHGTEKDDFKIFDRLKSTEWRQVSMDTVGAWFSNNPSSQEGAGLYGRILMPVYLNIKNPKIYRTFNEFLRDMHRAAGRPMPEEAPGRGSAEELRKELKAQGYDGIAFEQTANESLMQDITDMQDAVERAKRDEFSVPRQDRQPYTQKRERLEQTLKSMRKELDEFGSSTEFDKQRVFVAFEPEQIKSAISNVGAFDTTQADMFANVEPTERPVTAELVTREALIREEQMSELKSLRQRLAAIPRKVAEQRIQVGEPLIIKSMLERAADLKHALLMSRERRDSPEQFLARALKEYDEQGIENKEVLDVIKAAYEKEPAILNGLLLSVKQAPEGMDRAAGAFLPMQRIVRLYKASSGVTNPTTIRHELTHSLEQMMTPEQRVVMVEQWQKALDRAIAKHQDEKHQKYFEAVLNLLDKPNTANYEKAIGLLPSYEMYQYISPSEYWAVNAEPLMAAQLGGHWQRFKAAVRRLFEGLKKVIGFDENYAVHKTFRDIMTGSKERITKDMLADYVMDVTGPVQNIEKDEDDALLSRYNRPNTPMLDGKPLGTFLLDQWKNGKQLFKDFVNDPVEAAKDTGDSAFDAAISARMKNVWFGAGLESRDFNRYGGQLRTSEGLAVASVALDNAIHSANIGIQVIFQGGLAYDPKFNRFVAVDRKLGMRGVYEAEKRMKDRLGAQKATNLINGYLEAKRSISIMNELYDRQDVYEGAKEDLERAVSEGASEKEIQDAKDLVADAQNSLKAVQKAASSVLMSEQEMRDFAALDERHPELREIMQNFNAVNQNLLRVWRDVGLLSEERYNSLSSIKDYVPWQRLMEDGEDPHTPLQSTTRNLANIGREKLFKRGAPTDVLDFKAKEGQNTFEVPASTVLRVEVDGKKVPTDLLSVTEDGKVRIDQPIEEGSLVVFKVTRPINNIIENMTQNVMRMSMNAIRHYAAARIVYEYGTRAPDGKLMTFPKVDKVKNRFNFIIDGQKVVVEISDPLVAASIYGMESLDLEMWKPLAMVSNFVRRSITLSGAFQIEQVLKDAPTAAMVTGVKRPDKLIGGVLKGLVTSLVQPAGKAAGVDIEPTINILRAAGIGGFHSPSRTSEETVKRRIGVMNRNTYSAMIQMLDHIGDSADMAQRVAVYKRVLAETGDEMQAVYQAANVINFLHRGSAGYAQVLFKTVPFMSAYANATDVLANALIGGNLKGMSRAKAMQRLAITTAMLSSLTLLYCMLVGGDPDYEELDDQTKMRNIIVPGTKIKLPMNTSAAYIWKAVPEMLYNKVINEGTKNEVDRTRLKKALSQAAKDMLLGPEPIPAGVRPVMEVVMDHNFFTGRGLIPENLKRVEGFEQWDASTSELAKGISSYTEIPGTDGKRVLSPIEADHLVRGLFGSVGFTAQWISNAIGEHNGDRPELTGRETPVVGRFIRPEVGRANEDLFYDLKGRVDEKYQTWKTLMDRGDIKAADAYEEKNSDLLDMYRDVNKFNDALGQINSEIRELGTAKDLGMTPEQRRKEITDLQREKMELVDDIREMRKEAGL